MSDEKRASFFKGCLSLVGRVDEDSYPFTCKLPSVAVLEYKRMFLVSYSLQTHAAAFNLFVSILQTTLHWIGLGTHCTGQMPFTPELKCWILIPWSELSCFALVLTASQEPLLLTLEQGVNNPQLTSALYLFAHSTVFQLFYFLSPISHLISSSYILASFFYALTPLIWLHSLQSFHLIFQASFIVSIAHWQCIHAKITMQALQF